MSSVTRHGKIRTLEQASSYLEGLINTERERKYSVERFDLDPIRRLARRLDDPQAELSVVHIAGSKGKGSTALFCEALVRASGDRVGVFTSPHLLRWTERFRIDGREVDEAVLANAVDRIAPHVDALREENPTRPPTFFDATTAVALLLFRDARVDTAIVEVGLGGRLDSTNIVGPRVCCITSIELEHTEILGETLAAIAGEKAGIIKPGIPVVMGDLPPEAAAVVEARARELDAPLFRFGHELGARVLSEEIGAQQVRINDGPLDVEVRLNAIGTHQAHNAALALALARRANRGPAEQAPSDSQWADVAKRGLEAASLPGRIEIVGRSPWRLVDSAHTSASMAALVRALDSIPHTRSHWVLSISAGKDSDSILRRLAPVADEITVTRAEPIRSIEPSEIAATIRRAAPGASVLVVPNPHLAVRAAYAAAQPDDLIVVAGSIYLAGIARPILLADGSDNGDD